MHASPWVFTTELIRGDACLTMKESSWITTADHASPWVITTKLIHHDDACLTMKVHAPLSSCITVYHRDVHHHAASCDYFSFPWCIFFQMHTYLFWWYAMQHHDAPWMLHEEAKKQTSKQTLSWNISWVIMRFSCGSPWDFSWVGVSRGASCSTMTFVSWGVPWSAVMYHAWCFMNVHGDAWCLMEDHGLVHMVVVHATPWWYRM